MKSIMIKILISLSAILLFTVAANKFFCSPSIFSPEIKSIKDIRIEEINSDSIKLLVIVTIENKNIISSTIKNLFVNMVYANDTLGSALKNKPVDITAKSYADIELSVNLSTRRAVSLFNTGEDSLKLRLVGKLTAVIAMVNIPIEIDLPLTFSLKDNLFKTIEKDSQKDKIISIDEASLKEIGLSESVVEIGFQLKNPYGLAFTLTKYPSKIYINGSYAGDGDLTGPLTLKAKNQIVNGKIVFKLNNFSSVTSLFSSLFSRKIEYETKGDLYLKILDYDIILPYNFKGVLIKL